MKLNLSPLRILSVLVVLLLFGSRWISYVGFQPLFLTDFLIAIAVTIWIFSRETKRPELIYPRGARPAKNALAVFAAWVFIRAIFSFTGGYQLIDIFRDFIPFAYVLVAFIVINQLKNSQKEFRQSLALWIERALGLHLIWCVIAVSLGSGLSIQQPFAIFGAGIFSFRPDIDTALVVAYFILKLRRWELGENKKFLFVKMLASLSVMALSPARASLLALFLCLAWFLSKSVLEEKKFGASQKTRSRGAIVFGALLTSVLALGFTTAGGRLLTNLGVLSTNTEISSSAMGTTNARQLVWTQVLDWVSSSQSRIFFGSGFGINFLDVTHTLEFLEGTTYTGVRSPHNFLITVIVRLGWPAVILFATLLAIVLSQNWISARFDALNFISMTIILALIPISFLGVILEAPFGAVPFYFSIGVLLSPAAANLDKRESLGGHPT